MWDELDGRLERCEARLHEARRLLNERQRRGDQSVPGDLLEIVAHAVLSMKEADLAAEALCQALRTEADQSAVLPYAHDPAVLSDLYRALGVKRAEQKHFPRPESGSEGDIGKSGDEGLGNAPIGVAPKPTPPLVGAGAARTFAEALEPPRNP